MRYILNDRFLLRGWEKLPHALADRKTGRVRFLSPWEMEALQLCDGRIETSLPLISRELRDLLPILEKNGIVRPAEAGETLRPEQEYRRYKARYIQMAHWSVTGRCNYRCKHCFMSAPDAKCGELSHEQIMKTVQELSDCGVMKVSLTGGEPLLRKDFLEIVDALIERDIRITQIYSNGALVREPLLKALDERGIHPEFNMSYDGVGWHDWLRGVPGAEEAVDTAFRLCRDMGFPTGAEMCLHRNNKHLLRETVLHLAELGCRHLKTGTISNEGEWKKHGGGLDLEADELFELYFAYLPQYYEDGMPLDLHLGGFFSASPREPQRYDIPFMRSPCDPTKTCLCHSARNVLYISPDGRALPCMLLSGMEIEKQFPLISELGLARCLTDPFYLRFIDTRLSEFLALHPECRACRYKSRCYGGCRASAMSDSGENDWMAIDETCCRFFRGGYADRVIAFMRELHPEIQGPDGFEERAPGTDADE